MSEENNFLEVNIFLNLKKNYQIILKMKRSFKFA